MASLYLLFIHLDYKNEIEATELKRQLEVNEFESKIKQLLSEMSTLEKEHENVLEKNHLCSKNLIELEESKENLKIEFEEKIDDLEIKRQNYESKIEKFDFEINAILTELEKQKINNDHFDTCTSTCYNLKSFISKVVFQIRGKENKEP